MEKYFFSEKDELFLTELKEKKGSKFKLTLELILYINLMWICSSFGFFLFNLSFFVTGFLIYFYNNGFSLAVGFVFLSAYFVFYKFYLKEKHEQELLPEFNLMNQAVQILKNRLKQYQ